MADADEDLTKRFPHLFRPEEWTWSQAHAVFSIALPDDALVTNVRIAGFVDDRIVVCREAEGFWFLPGGTREPGETVTECAARELMEEAGGRLVGPPHWFGAHYVVSYRAEPIRAADPHPVRAVLWGLADVVIDSAPTNPADAEQVTEVRVALVQEAQRLLRIESEWGAELLDFAAELRRTSAPQEF